MKSFNAFLSFLFLCVFSTFAFAFAEAEVIALVAKQKIYDVNVFPNAKDYPVEVTSTGAQGTVLLAIQIDAESKVTSALVKESSRDEVIDNLAVKLLLKPVKLGFNPKDNYSTSEVRITFIKDDPFKMKFKACADANVDGVYFKRMYPDKPINEMRFWTALSGLMFVTYSSQKPYADSDTNKILDDTIADCLVHPENNVFDTYFRIAKIKPIVR